MPIPKKIINFLDKHDIGYEILEHKTVYTAFDAAQTMGKKLSEIAKTLAVKVDKKYVLVVVPASHKINFDKLKKLLKAKKITIVKEVDIKNIFKVKPGTLLPFGVFHKIPVFIDKTLLKSKVVIVSAGSYTQSLKLKAKDLIEHGAETLTIFSKAHKFKKQKITNPKKPVKKTVTKKKCARKPCKEKTTVRKKCVRKPKKKCVKKPIKKK